MSKETKELTLSEQMVASQEAILKRLKEPWTDELLGMLYEREMVVTELVPDDENPLICPTVNGLKRLVEQIIGPIIKTEISLVQQASHDNGGTAVAKASITVFDLDKKMPIQYEDIADAASRGKGVPIGHEAATAATRARGRVYRQFLCLDRVYTNEEMSSTGGAPARDRITPQQEKILETTCNNLGIDYNKFLVEGMTKIRSLKPSDDMPELKSFSTNEAKQLMQFLSSVQNDENLFEKLKKGSPKTSESTKVDTNNYF